MTFLRLEVAEKELTEIITCFLTVSIHKYLSIKLFNNKQVSFPYGRCVSRPEADGLACITLTWPVAMGESSNEVCKCICLFGLSSSVSLTKLHI